MQARTFFTAIFDHDSMGLDLRVSAAAFRTGSCAFVAVEAAYGDAVDGDEEKIVAHLFNLYEAATGSR